MVKGATKMQEKRAINVWNLARSFWKSMLGLTCKPNELVTPLRLKAMPVVLEPALYEDWLSTDYLSARAMVRLFRADQITIDEVGDCQQRDGGIRASWPRIAQPAKSVKDHDMRGSSSSIFEIVRGD